MIALVAQSQLAWIETIEIDLRCLSSHTTHLCLWLKLTLCRLRWSYDLFTPAIYYVIVIMNSILFYWVNRYRNQKHILEPNDNCNRNQVVNRRY